jgi:hypothetical protein
MAIGWTTWQESDLRMGLRYSLCKFRWLQAPATIRIVELSPVIPEAMTY